jgi:hypothetical protein
MRHLKRFNESAFGVDSDSDKSKGIEKIREFEDVINSAEFTPKADQVPLKSLYNVIAIKTQDPINTKNFTSFAAGRQKTYDTNWILLEFRYGKFSLGFYPSESELLEWTTRYGWDFRDDLILDWNDINHAEIENILSDFGIVADEIYGRPI